MKQPTFVFSLLAWLTSGSLAACDTSPGREFDDPLPPGPNPYEAGFMAVALSGGAQESLRLEPHFYDERVQEASYVYTLQDGSQIECAQDRFHATSIDFSAPDGHSLRITLWYRDGVSQVGEYEQVATLDGARHQRGRCSEA